MASMSTQQLTTNGTTGSTNTQSAPRARDWGRTGEPGSAFSGLSRGRGRGRGGSNTRVTRGSRGGRGKSPADTPSDVPAPVKVEVSMIPSTTPAPAPVGTLATNPSPAAPVPASKGKAPSKRASRPVPALVLDPSSPTSSSPSNNTSTPRTPNRRHRSQHKATNPTTCSSDNLIVPDLKPRARKARSNVPPPLSSKDLPPHLNASAGPETSTFDIKNDIDALVERVRAVAMAENRPTTPGSHIDWAGDEDDTLPDLDDWGVSPATDMGNAISPISVGGLTPLPEPTEQPLIVSEATEPPTHASDVPTINIVKVVDRSDPDDRSQSNALSETTVHFCNSLADSSLPPNKDKSQPELTSHTKAIEIPPNKSLAGSVLQESITTIPECPRTPLHPSLPPKPVAAMESLSAPSKSRIVVRLPNSVTSSIPTASLGADVINSVSQPPTSNSQSESQAASMQNSTSSQQETAVEQKEPQGLSASMHAPHNNSESPSVPSYISSHSSPTAPHAFQPTHHRSHTVGRSPPSFPAMISHSGYSTPRGRFSPSGNHHARTHSSPADSPMSRRIPHATRPIITGDALSKLARTICNTGASPTRTVAMASSKD